MTNERTKVLEPKFLWSIPHSDVLDLGNVVQNLSDFALRAGFFGSLLTNFG
ncbi:hypothetical protein F7734_22025 [Scytonema sp. UIC 10036]|uniref:hypothetical protein n=1 Tax=Scytonema sp. UIC 10036 TaxID=2304196 RepID=UPI0012DAE6FB|nr:hypothetical protein [Scytonema sp. UIC 10036]MUG94895.1 hypothetical protein [Scytonema sp. UIC 10036]